MAFAGSDRRKHPRLAVKFPVKFKIQNGQEDTHVFQAVGKDISAGGLCMEMAVLHERAMDKVFKSSGSLDMEIEVSDMGKSIRTRGEVVWMRKDQGNDVLGILFKDISEEERNILSTYISQRLK